MQRNYIGGEWVAGSEAVPDLNPSNLADVVGEYARASAPQAEQAIAAARDASPGWADAGIQKRSEVLDAAGAELLARRDELGRLLSREEGKTLREGVAEVARAGQIFKFFAGEALRLGGERLPSTRPGVDVEVLREPIGVVGLITPWNFPIAIPAWKVAPALAFGNAVVLKPAEAAPACAWALAEILSRAGLPPGVFNLVVGKGSVVGDALVRSPHVAGVSFTGSVETGRQILRKLAERGARAQLEMGGKNPLVVLDDAELEVAVRCAVQGAFHSTGQRCTASSRLVVTQGIHDRFVAALTAAMTALRVGDALDPATDLGPVIDQAQLDQDLRYVELGRRCARVAAGGERLRRATEGFYLSPALVTETTNDMAINREEIFGPVATVIRVRDYEEAVKVANDTEYGLSSGICTTSLRHASDFKRRSQAGMVMVNLPTAGVDPHVPFGGRKGSSYGPREQGTYAREFYTVVKTAYTAP
jgi:acyl-CoA reductase-like NAD-dependent aldehyde dehydrogenase